MSAGVAPAKGEVSAFFAVRVRACVRVARDKRERSGSERERKEKRARQSQQSIYVVPVNWRQEKIRLQSGRRYDVIHANKREICLVIL